MLALGIAFAADPWDALAVATAKPAAEAVPALEQLITANPVFHAARFNLGTLLIERDAAKAAEHLQLATQAESADLVADAWHNLALARWHQGRLEDALAAALKAAELKPAHAPLRDELRRVALVRQDEARRKAAEEAKKLAVLKQPMPEAHVGEPYQQPVPVRGGIPPYRFALHEDSTKPGDTALPPGLTLGSDGRLSGIPTKAGPYRFIVALSDAANGSVTGAATVTVVPAPRITTEALPDAVIGQPYQAQLVCEGLASPTWTVGKLPPGLRASADGRISGTPIDLGSSTLMVQVRDGTKDSARRADRLIDLTVSDAFAPDRNPLAQATAGQPYLDRVGIRGPAQSYAWSAPIGGQLAIDVDGTVRGTPAAPGSTTISATIKAGDGRSRTVDLVVPVAERPLIDEGEPITIHTGEAVARPLKATGGTTPFGWSVSEGSLPTGVRLDADGALRGAAKDPGEFTVTVQLMDRWKATTQAQVTVKVEPRSKDESPPDQQKDDQQDQQGQDQQQAQKQQGKDPQSKDSPSKDQQQQAQGQDQQQQAHQDQGQQSAEQAQADAAQQLDQVAADRWLDHLPEENRSVLRYQLLEGGDKKAEPKGKAW